jgi:hypothetical protein
MYQEIKRLADEALALQNKDRMDAALREISGMCEAAPAVAPVALTADEFEAAELEQHQAAKKKGAKK